MRRPYRRPSGHPPLRTALGIRYRGWQQPWDFAYPPFNLDAYVMTVDNVNPMDWTALKPTLRPEAISPEAWEPVFANFVSMMGTTIGDMVRELDTLSAYLGSLGR